jgi:hypothetical protein
MPDYRNPNAAGTWRVFPSVRMIQIWIMFKTYGLSVLNLPCWGAINPAALPFWRHGFTIPKTPLNQYGPNFDPLLLPCRQAGLLKLSVSTPVKLGPKPG